MIFHTYMLMTTVINRRDGFWNASELLFLPSPQSGAQAQLVRFCPTWTWPPRKRAGGDASTPWHTTTWVLTTYKQGPKKKQGRWGSSWEAKRCMCVCACTGLNIFTPFLSRSASHILCHRGMYCTLCIFAAYSHFYKQILHCRWLIFLYVYRYKSLIESSRSLTSVLFSTSHSNMQVCVPTCFSLYVMPHLKRKTCITLWICLMAKVCLWYERNFQPLGSDVGLHVHVLTLTLTVPAHHLRIVKRILRSVWFIAYKQVSVWKYAKVIEVVHQYLFFDKCFRCSQTSSSNLNENLNVLKWIAPLFIHDFVRKITVGKTTEWRVKVEM